MLHTIEIKASTRVTGKRFFASVEAARRKVVDGKPYLIRRHGGYFRPGAHGYTDKLAHAGVFTGAEARKYLDVEGLSVVPLEKMTDRIAREAEEAETAAVALRNLLAAATAR